MVEQKCPHILVDVREPVELDICSLPGSLSILCSKMFVHSIKNHSLLNKRCLVNKYTHPPPRTHRMLRSYHKKFTADYAYWLRQQLTDSFFKLSILHGILGWGGGYF